MHAIADFEGSGLDIGGGELAGFFASDFEVRGSAVGTDGCEDGTGLDGPNAVGLDESEIGIFVNRGDATDEAGLFFLCFWGGYFSGFVSAGGEEDEEKGERFIKVDALDRSVRLTIDD